MFSVQAVPQAPPLVEFRLLSAVGKRLAKKKSARNSN